MKKKIIIFGNSGSGKSTISKTLSIKFDLVHLDLDTLAWQESSPPVRRSLCESKKKITHFIKENDGWVIEGCYADLIEMVIPDSSEIIYMNLPVEICVENAKKRPWEPHKYETKISQDANLEMLLNWITKYLTRTDSVSKTAHDKLFDEYSRVKRKILNNCHF